MSNPKEKRGVSPPHAPWTVREESVFSLMHAYRMYLEVATLTEDEECRARNLKNAKRVRGLLHDLIPQLHFGSLMRHCVCGELDSLDARRAALSADVWAQALSLMYPMGAPQQSGLPERVGER
jgi:hypothetical protein